MPEQEVVIETPKVETPEVKVEVPKPDLVSRVASFKEAPKTEQPKNEFGISDEDYQKVLTDPTLSKYYKSMQSGYNKKFQEVAELRKNLEQQANQTKAWTPQRIQELMNDPNFVQAAQSVVQTQAPSTYKGSQQEWSSLTEGEQSKFVQMEREIIGLKQQAVLNELKAQDAELQKRYANYDPKELDLAVNDILSNKLIVTREHIYKALHHDDNVQNAYKLGGSDILLEHKEKSNAISADGSNVAQASNVPDREPKETNQSYFRRIFASKLAQQQSQTR